jgi:hypothetical protein
MKLTHFNRRILRLALVWVLAAAVGAFGVNSHAGTATGALTTACSDNTSAAVIPGQGASPASSDSSSAAIDQGSMPDSENPSTNADSGGIQVVTVLF